MTEHVQMPQGPLRLETDLRLTFLLLNEARHRTMESVFGLSREQANLATLVLVASLAGSAGRRVHRMMSQPPPVPTRGDTALGVSLMRELVQSIAGPTSRDTSTFGTLVAVAAMGGVALPMVRRSIRVAESGMHGVSAGFRHRYGVHATLGRGDH